MLTKENIADWFKQLQLETCQALEIADGKAKFSSDKWSREEGGGGDSRIVQHGNVIEKGGVNFSAVWGNAPAMLVKELNLSSNNSRFFASGVSIVIHPENPFVPIIHMNVRYFEIDENTWWFGGGIDLTPIYVDKEEAHFFHNQLKIACDKHDPNFYSDFKKWADDYFFIKHRNETRGIGGIFFDKLNSGKTKEKLFAFVKEIGNSFAPTYTQIIGKKRNLAFTAENKQWQFLRRGRYAEFNLVYDRGTKFGLETNGRVESILMSLPPQANWIYNHLPIRNSLENQTVTFLRKGIQWSDV
jgi:coproporphyrinogen III oxidase